MDFQIQYYTKVPKDYITELGKNNHKIHLEEQKVKTPKGNNEKIERKGPPVPDLRTVYSQLKNIRGHQWNRLNTLGGIKCSTECSIKINPMIPTTEVRIHTIQQKS